MFSYLNVRKSYHNLEGFDRNYSECLKLFFAPPPGPVDEALVDFWRCKLGPVEIYLTMIIQLKKNLGALSASTTEFLALAGPDAWRKRAVQLARDAGKSPFLEKIVSDYHWLELALSEQLARQEMVSRFVHEHISLETLAAMRFAQMVVEVHRRSSPAGQAALSGRIRHALTAETGFASLYLEMDTARRLMEASFDVEFSDLEGLARYDVRFWKGDVEGEVECKSLSTDAGRKIHRKHFYRFMDAIGPQIVRRVEGGANEVLLITLTDRLPSNSLQQGVLRKAMGRMLAQPALETVQEDFFCIQRENFSEGLDSASRGNTKEFYRVCRQTYGDNCHVSGVTMPDRVCLIVMRSSSEDDHSRPLLGALREAASQFSKTRPAFIALQFDDISPSDLLLTHLRRRVGILSYALFHRYGASHVGATYFCPYAGLAASTKGIGAPAVAIPNPAAKFPLAPSDYSPFLASMPDGEFAELLGGSPPSESLSYIPFDDK